MKESCGLKSKLIIFFVSSLPSSAHTIISKLSTLEDLVLKRINHKMRSVLDAVEENSNGMKEGCYLNKMNDLKDFNDFLESIKRADHN